MEGRGDLIETFPFHFLEKGCSESYGRTLDPTVFMAANPPTSPSVICAYIPSFNLSMKWGRRCFLAGSMPVCINLADCSVLRFYVVKCNEILTQKIQSYGLNETVFRQLPGFENEEYRLTFSQGKKRLASYLPQTKS